ncbi:MAG: S8 family serine peptidase [Acidobacteriia bacterium]|nr:S8 family serine peptidase [Terriglobia bacterium]
MPKISVALFAAVGGILGLMGAGAGWAQSTNYQTRFSEELRRKVPPISMPAPSKAELDAGHAPKALAMEIEEAKKMLGLEALGPNIAARIPGGKLGIVDMGFRGIKEWLAAHPEEAKLVTYHALDPSKGEPELTDANTVDHGYWVYRVTRAVLPGVPIHLYATSGDDVASALEPVVDGSARDGVVVFNMSLGLSSECQLDEEKEDEFSKDLRLALVQREAFLFISAGNSRANTHTWVSADSNGNGYVDFRSATEAARHAGSDMDGARVTVTPGNNRFYFSWDARRHPQDDYALELVARDGKPLATARREAKDAPGACVILDYQTDEESPATLRVKRLAGDASGTLMRVTVDGYVDSAGRADFNGLQTALAYEFRENPFVIFVGAFGKTAGGKFAPSYFSDIGRTEDGRLVPDVMGPGQLLIDGHEENGTSFASPFLTALYATRVGYNLKNLVERTAGFERFAAGVAAFERGRLGIPDAQKVTQELAAITGPTKVENVSHKVEGSDLVLRYSISRCCMQSLVWYAAVVLLDGATHAPLKDAQGKTILAYQELRTEESGRMSYPVELHVPMSALEAYKGKTIEVYFAAKVRAWQAPPPGSLKVDEAPVYRFTP